MRSWWRVAVKAAIVGGWCGYFAATMAVEAGL